MLYLGLAFTKGKDEKILNQLIAIMQKLEVRLKSYGKGKYLSGTSVR
jgi:hypothetical protein